MTEETQEENTGVNEGVADSGQEQQTSDQEINWKKANETMAEQKRRLEEVEQQNKQYQQQLGVFQNYLNQYQQAQQEPKDDLGIAEDDVLTGADLKKALSKKEQEFQKKFGDYENQMRLVQLRAQYPDYEETVKNTIKMAETDPQLAQAIQSSENPGLLAYKLGKMQKEQSQPKKETEKMIENSQKPGSMNQSTSGSGGFSKVDYFLDMSDKDFEKHIAKVKGGFG